MTRFKKQFVIHVDEFNALLESGWEVWEYDGDGIWLIQEMV